METTTWMAPTEYEADVLARRIRQNGTKNSAEVNGVLVTTDMSDTKFQQMLSKCPGLKNIKKV